MIPDTVLSTLEVLATKQGDLKKCKNLIRIEEIIILNKTTDINNYKQEIIILEKEISTLLTTLINKLSSNGPSIAALPKEEEVVKEEVVKEDSGIIGRED